MQPSVPGRDTGGFKVFMDKTVPMRCSVTLTCRIIPPDVFGLGPGTEPIYKVNRLDYTATCIMFAERIMKT